MPRCPAASPGTLSGDDPSAAHRGLVPYANGPPGPRMANVPENSWKEPRPERDDDGDDHDARRETLAPKFDGVRSTRQGVVAPGLPLGTVKPRKRQGGESALSALSAPDAARAASACAGDASEAASRPRRPPPPPRLPLPLPNAKGSVPIPGTATPGDDASREASAERNPPPEEPRPEEAPAGEADRNPSASAKPKIGAGPETGADAGARGESGGLDDEEGVAGPSPLAPLAGVPWKGECDPFTKDEGTPTSFPVPVPSTEDPIRASGSNLAISALSNPGRLESARRAPAFAAGPPAADVASAIPTRLGGGGSVHVVRLRPKEKRREPKLLRRAGRGGQELRRARLPAPRAPRARLFFFCFFFRGGGGARRVRVRVRRRVRVSPDLVTIRAFRLFTHERRVSDTERGERVGVEEEHGRVQAPAARRGRGGERVRAIRVRRRVFFFAKRSRSAPLRGGTVGRSEPFGRRRVGRGYRRYHPARGDAGHAQRRFRRGGPPRRIAAARLGPRRAPRATKRRRFRKRLLPFAVLAAPPADREGDAHSLGAVLRETLSRAARVPVRGKRAELGVQRAEKHNQLLVRRRDGWATGSRLGVGTHRTGSRGNLRVVAEHPPLDQYLFRVFRVAQRVGLEKNLEHHASRRRLGRRLRRVAAPRPQRLGARRALVRLQVELRRSNASDVRSAIGAARARRARSVKRGSRGDETRAARSFAREEARALGFSRFFVERNALSRSFWLFGVFGERVSERHRLALDAGTHPSVLPVLPGRGGRWLTRHARLQHHRRALHEPLRANLRRAVAHGARSVRVYLLLAIRSKNSRETTWAR